MDQAEQLRRLVKSQSQPKPTARVITVTSGKGGVGKSNMSVNLGIQLSKAGKRVIILDADFGLANVEVMLGIRPQYNLADLLYKNKSIKEIITTGPFGLGFISGGSGVKELSNLDRNQIIQLTEKMSELDDIADIIIVDTGAGISDSVLEFITASSEVLLVTTPEPTSITDAYALLKTLDKREEFIQSETIIKVIANRVLSEKEGIELYQKLSVVVNRFLNLNIEFLGPVLYDMNVTKAVMKQAPVSLLFPNTSAAKGMCNIANQLLDKGEIKVNHKRGISELFSKLMSTKLNR
ncbi:MinD/ParA family protein [Anaeromicropila herbilytica]|uniref:Site-determining protein n=1 Tax=Anaeromicropila herbilytica TaxID=2785025 RepID=A0A7R7EMJ9_9FIRM|nr:MinD/ParA family protein [Anaeromicropila herbilytica]BCN31514.1 site-determining protein [Anaeromicropila herbilytica]